MSEIKNSFLDLVGNTPLVRVNNLIKKDELKADVLAKLGSEDTRLSYAFPGFHICSGLS